MIGNAPETAFTNARIVTRDAVFTGRVVVRDGIIAAVDAGADGLPGALDLDGDHLLPGLIELHTDNLERHFEPRPNVLWPSPLAAVLGHDAQVAAAGITTVLDAVCVGEYRDGGKRRYILNESIAAIKQALREDLLRIDHLLHLRCEVADPLVVEMFEPYSTESMVQLVSIMDHTPGQRQWRDLAVFRRFYRGEGRSDADIDAMVAQGEDYQARYALKHRVEIVKRCRDRGIPLASHDDETEDQVREAAADGMVMSEFPTTMAAAAHARHHGLGVIMGAPNVVRGGSHSGNVSAGELARADLLDCLSSDYVPVSLLHAAFLLHDTLHLPLPEAVAKISANPARLVGLDDRGEIAPGRRADLIRVRKSHGQPVVTAVWRQGVRVV